jgi:hypothetical protein
MSKKVAPRVQFNFEPDVIEEPETINNDLLIENSDVINEDYDSLEMPEVIEKEQIVEDNIFESCKSKVNKDLEISEINEPVVSPVKPVKPIIKKVQSPKPQKKKRVLSKEHKAKLALAREKALATRRAKAEEKKRMKQIENETKVLRKKKAEKDLEDLKSNVNNADKSQPVPTTNSAPVQSFTKQDLENAQLSAIIQYETIRKARKEEKKKEKMIQEQKEQMKRQIARYGAKDTNGRLLNRWDSCY